MPKVLRKATTPAPPKRIRKVSKYGWPDVSRLAVNKPRFSGRDGAYLIPYEKAPLDAPGYIKIRLSPGKTYFTVDKITMKPNGLITEMPNGLLLAHTSCGACHSHWSQCKCPNGLTCSRSIEYVFDATTAESKGEEWNAYHPNYLGSLLRKDKEYQERRLLWISPKPTDGPRTTAPRDRVRLRHHEEDTGPRRLRKAGQATSPPPTKRLRKAAPAVPVMESDTSKVMRGHTVDQRALDTAAQDQAKELSQIANRMLSKGDAPKRLRKAPK
jgi:hypothetical protein